MYSMDHGGAFPSNMAVLVDFGANSPIPSDAFAADRVPSFGLLPAVHSRTLTPETVGDLTLATGHSPAVDRLSESINCGPVARLPT
jgi:hypothetical protein